MIKFISFVFALTTFSLYAQSNYNISGTIVDNDGLPQIGASVVLHNPSDSTIITGGVTKVGGNFKFEAKSGNYYIRITSVGMEPKVLDNINLTSDLKLGEIRIAQSSVLTDEVLVTAEKSIMELKLDKRIYNINKDASNIGRNGSEILDNIPSVNVDPEGNVSLRGSGNVQILLNGKQSGLVSNNPESIRQLMGDMIDKIEIITNQ